MWKRFFCAWCGEEVIYETIHGARPRKFCCSNHKAYYFRWLHKPKVRPQRVPIKAQPRLVSQLNNYDIQL